MYRVKIAGLIGAFYIVFAGVLCGSPWGLSRGFSAGGGWFAAWLIGAYMGVQGVSRHEKKTGL